MTNLQKNIFDGIDFFNDLRVKEEEWGADNLDVLNDHAKKMEKKNAVSQRRFDDDE